MMNNEEKILQLLEQMNGHIGQMDGRIGRLEGSIERLDGRVEQMDGRFEQMDRRFEQMDRRFEQMDGRFEQMDGRIGVLEQGQAEMRKDINKLNQTVAAIEVGHGKKLDALYDGYVDASRKIDTLQATVDEIAPTVVALDVLQQMRGTK